MHRIGSFLDRIKELEELLETCERKADILTNLLIEANAEFERAIEKVSISEANFRTIFTNAPEAIFIIDGQTHEILDSNAFAHKWLGYPPDFLCTVRLDQIMVTAADYFRNGAPEPGRIQEQRFRTYDGGQVYAEVVSTALKYLDRECLLILARDVTERKQLEELSRYKEIFKSGTDPVFINDYRGNILEVNDVACRTFGYRREEFLRLTLKDLTVPGQIQVLQQTRQQIEQGLTIRFEWETITKTGEVIPFEFHARPITYLGQPAVLSVGRDLSLRRRLEQTLVATARLTAVGEMASGVAHNFNNLLQMILGATEVALSKLAAGKIRSCQEALQQIQAASQRGSEIVRRIKDFALTQDSDLESVVVFPLGDVLQEAAELTTFLWKDLADSRKYHLQVQVQPDCLVQGRPSEIYEVVINLLKNALEAMPDGGTVTLAAQVVGDRVHVDISDTGIGIPPENLERLFQPFFTTKGVQSSGLGLSSSYGIIKRHGGEIQVHSTVGRGTTFTIKLPLAAGPVAAKRQPPVAAASDRIKFLLIEDELTIIKAMEAYFEDTEVDLTACQTAAAGLQAFAQQEFDVILCDLGLADLTGWEVGEWIKEHCQRRGAPKPPFLIYTGWDRPFDAQKLTQSGVDRVVVKPIACFDLLNLLRDVVRISAQRKSFPPSACRSLHPLASG